MSLAAKLPEPPPSIASVVVSRGGQSHTVILYEVQTFKNKALDPDVNAHREQPSTALSPALTKGDGTVTWYVGHDLGTREHAGDTVRTWSLLLHVHGTEAKALWYEDHQEVPHTFAMGAGSAEAGELPGILIVDLSLKDADYGDPLSVRATLRIP